MSRGGRLPDPGLAALCGRPECGEPREAHGGDSHYGACPGESGLYAKRFSIAAEDRPPPESIVVRQARAVRDGGAELGARLPLGYRSARCSVCDREIWAPGG